MFDKLKKLGKKEKQLTSETEEFYSEEGDFGEFENIKVDKNSKQEATNYYEEVSIEEKKKKRNKAFIIIFGSLLLLLVAAIVINVVVLREGKLKAINVDVPTIVYLGESTEITGNATGSGALWQTAYNFDTTNAGVADLQAKGQITGKRVKNEIIPITTGRFAIITKAKLGNIELGTEAKQVIVCRKLTNQSLTTEKVIVEEKATNRVNLDVGSDDECFKALTYKISDESVARIDELGNITGIKEGTAILTITDGTTEVKETIEVLPTEDITKVKDIKLEASNITIKVGDEKAIKYTIEPTTATNKTLIWTTNNQGVATVSAKGVVKGIGAGTGTITVTTEDKKISKLIIVKVEKKETTTPSPTEPVKDTTAPKLTSVKIYSDNVDKTKAQKGNTITVEVKADEKLATKPSIYIAEQSVSVTCQNTTTPTCKGSYVVKSSDKAGIVTLKVVGYKDASGNTGNQVTTPTDKSSVTIYILGWNDYSETPCDTTDTENCKATNGFLKQTCIEETTSTITVPGTPCSWVGSGGDTINPNNCGVKGTCTHYYCWSATNGRGAYAGCWTSAALARNYGNCTVSAYGSGSYYWASCNCEGGSSATTTTTYSCTSSSSELTISCTAAGNYTRKGNVRCTPTTLYQTRLK